MEQGTIFSVAQYRGQPGLGYFCLEAEKATLYHRGVGATAAYITPGREVSGGLCAVSGVVSSLSWAHKTFFSAAIEDYLLPTHLEVPSFAPPAQLAPTIYPSEEGVTERGTLGRKSQGPPMLSAAVRIHLDPHKNVKVQVPLLLTHMHDLGSFPCTLELGLHHPD